MIEIQIHPSDIRRKVRYFFFDRRRVEIGIVLLGLMFAFVIASMAVAPTVIRRVYKNTYLLAMREERAVQRERLKQYVDQMSSLEKALDEQRVRVEKLVTVYGLDETVAGQGGIVSAGSGGESTLDTARTRERQLKISVRRLQQQINLLTEYEAANASLVRHTPSILPIPADQFVLTSAFGNRISPFTRAADFHKGLDLAAPTGTAIYAAADGVVTFAGRVSLRDSVSWWRFGNVVVVKHADRFMTIYAHCDTVQVKQGQVVTQGQAIATVGSTGWSTNSHLHYEIRTDLASGASFDPVDPRIYILNYQWTNEEKILAAARSSKDYKDYEPLPKAFLGRRRV